MLNGRNWHRTWKLPLESVNEAEYLATGSKNFLKLNSLFLFIKRSLIIVISNISQNQSLLRYWKDAALHRWNLFWENEVMIIRKKKQLLKHTLTTQVFAGCMMYLFFARKESWEIIPLCLNCSDLQQSESYTT